MATPTFYADLSRLGFTERQIERLDRMAYDYSNARLPMTVGAARRRIYELLEAHRSFDIDAIADLLWKE